MPYPEIDQLRSYFNNRMISFDRFENEDPYFYPIKFSIDQKSWEIFIYDEYLDFSLANPLICLDLTFVALDDYYHSEDILKWCLYNGLDSSDPKWLDYYRGLAVVYRDIEAVLVK